MSSIVARTGRHLQRYDNNLRLVSGCIPYRLVKTKDQHNDTKKRIEVLMVSSPNRDDMVFPKGGWESDETAEEAACREALEEAGVRGNLKGNSLGVWEFRSKSKEEACSKEGGCKGYMFALEVTEELETWPEQKNRSRKWVGIEEAFMLCRYEWMRNALTEFLRVIEKGKNKREDKAVEIKDDKKLEFLRVIEKGKNKREDKAVEIKDDKKLTKEDEDCQLMSTNCHVNGSMTLSTSYGIMLPSSIFL